MALRDMPARPYFLIDPRAAEDGNLVALEHAIWQLLEVFFIDAPRSGGFVAEVQSGYVQL